MFDELIDCLKQNTGCHCPENTGTQLDLRSQMMEKRGCFFIAFAHEKIVAHYEDDVNVVGVRPGSDVTTKNHEPCEFASGTSEFINA